MRLIYSFGIWLYWIGARVAALFGGKARLFVDGRRGVMDMLRRSIEPGGRYIWFHVASLGEFEQGRPIMERIRQERPEYKILLTFFSPSGYEIRKNYKGADVVCYLPMDTPGNARRFLDICKPQMAVFVKYEFWLNYLAGLKERNTPTYIVSAIFRPGQAFFKWWGGWYRGCLDTFTHLFVQDEQSVRLLGGIGIDRTTVAGDTRYDRVLQIAKGARRLPVVEAFKRGESPVLIAGSSWPKDEDLLLGYLNQSRVRFILAPHEVDEGHIAQIVQKLKRPYVRYTQATEEDAARAECLIIDCIGLLSSVYQYGEVAYIGGGFGVGIHNILEPAVYGMPVVFGPNYHKFKEAEDMAAAGGAFPFETQEQLNALLDGLLAPGSEKLKASAQTAGRFVAQNSGATDKIMARLFGR